MPKATPISAQEFDRRKADLYQVLLKQLKDQKDECFIPDTPAETDVFDTPEVDSKTVIKLSSTTEQWTGHKLKPQWVRKGGYDSVEEAAKDVIDQIRKNCYGSNARQANTVREVAEA